jgi:hypothetical protein
MQPENLPLEDRLKVAAMASRFFECIAVWHRQDAAIVASIERSLCDPEIRARIAQLLSPKGT